ncbi:heat-shock protein HtpX [Methanoculleus taiwanensis]|uniref:Protease HtpX homolog n=1 Tax=Methanoculleus taiwanensis TaxID=1550565 RepID=A0A498H1E2_9EURY|nr:zinc metalloprotease HtpX [Methanoculleus taiwanensis]RXE56642.1 heat-shock protein HtpX [Methanoculleus taiwanensis]
MKWTRDFGLTARMALTSFLLLIVYLIFLGVLSALGFSFEFLLIVAAGMAFAQYFFSDKLVLWSTGTRIVEEDEYPDLHRSVRRLATEAGLPMPKIGIMASPVPNAFATGRNYNNAVVAVTDSIMRILSKEELEAVLAHELSHVKNRDMLTLTLASFISMLAFLVMRNWFFIGLFGRRDNNAGALIVVFIASILVWVMSTLLIRALSRYREFAADRGSAYMTGNPRALISALQKISGRMDYVPAEKKQEVEGANAFFIIPALSGNTLMELFSTHPSLEKRVAALEALESEVRGY